jgi:mono/diheme cytochrome c family protein
MRILASIGALAVVAAVAAAIYFFGGFYSVAATTPDSGIIAWALGHVRAASIKQHATDTAPFALDDQSVIQAGARAFATRSCATCHGAPGADWAKFAEAIRPDPPDLKDIAKERSPAEIFWVVKNGIKMTGMPGFSLINADDRELWQIAAFVKKLPNISADEYKSWSQQP